MRSAGPAFTLDLKAEIRKRAERLCENCQRRGEKNPLRVFDCKVPSCQPVIAELPTITDRLCSGCKQHFEKLQSYLTTRAIRFKVNPLRLVRGFDYYKRTTFEITSSRLGAQNTVAGGGRYDGLSETLGGSAFKGFWFRDGHGKAILLIPNQDQLTPDYSPEYFIAPMGDAAFEYATLLARRLRAGGKRVYLDFDPRSLKSQMRLADKLKAKSVVIVGDEELKAGTLVVRDMATKEQQTIRESEILGRDKS